MIPLFENYPGLEENLPYNPFAGLPTPVIRADKAGDRIGADSLFIKRDDISAAVYGGNKIRKLEFLLADALNKGADTVLTYGAAGSNHAVATAVHAKALGLKTIVVMINQFNAAYVRKNLLMHLYCGSDLYLADDVRNLDRETIRIVNKYRNEKNTDPYIIPVGGTSPLGTCGFVNAAMELKKQVESGMLPEPDYIYTGFGSNGTAAGLILGLKAAGMKTQVVPVCVVEERWSNAGTLAGTVNAASDLLHNASEKFPSFRFEPEELSVDHNHFGRAYSLFTKEGMAAVELMKETENIKLDGTYTGKAFAALISDAKEGRLNGKTALFWDTLNSHDLSEYTGSQDFLNLPQGLRKYFIDKVQDPQKA